MESEAKILLVDDEAAITDNLAPFLERAGYDVQVASDGEQALRAASRFDPDLIILDVLMPRMDGRAVLRHLRQNDDWTAVILLTQVGHAGERAMALEEGADDYLNKPFDPQELVARMRAVLRRVSMGQPRLAAAEKLVSGDVSLDRVARRVTREGKDLPLTPRAVTLLEYMMSHPDEVMSRERLLDAVWGWDYPTGTRTVDTRIAEIRRVLGDDPAEPRFIETMPGQGYRFIGRVSG